MTEVIPTEIDRERVRALVRAGAQLVEVLSNEEYERVHLAGAASIPLDTIDRLTAEELKWDEPVIVYCYDYQ
jgi:rhodanese-related sulfurtransferase